MAMSPEMDCTEFSNDILQSVFKELHSTIINDVDVDDVRHYLFSKGVITPQFNNDLEYLNPVKRCSRLMTKLHVTGHSTAFIELRLALVNSSNSLKWLVDKVDKLHNQQKSMQINDHADEQVQLASTVDVQSHTSSVLMTSTPLSETSSSLDLTAETNSASGSVGYDVYDGNSLGKTHVDDSEPLLKKKRRDDLHLQSSGYNCTSISQCNSFHMSGDASQLRENQQLAIALLEDRKRFTYIHAAGHGKSHVYLTAAKNIAQRQKKMTLVVLPLIALIRNLQKSAKAKFSLTTVRVDGTTKCSDNWTEMQELVSSGKAEVILTTPEQLSSDMFCNDDFINNLGLLVVDECHCVYDWGHDFRPSYRRLAALIERLPTDVAIFACTATASPTVEENIKSVLHLTEPTIRGSLRINKVELHVLRLNFKKLYALAWLAHFVPGFEGQGIIYCLSAADCEQVTDILRFKNVEARAYYNGVRPNPLLDFDVTDQEPDKYREELERKFDENKIKVLVATTAFGMGYDKQDVSFVILYNVPVSMAAIYQQIGRCGRGASNARAFILFDNYGKADGALNVTNCWRQNYFLKSTLCTPEDFKSILSALQKEIGTTIDELCGVVNISRETIEKVLTFLECLDNPSVIRKDKKWVLVGEHMIDYQEINKCKSQTAEVKSSEWEMSVFPFVARDKSCLMHQLTSALGDSEEYECMNCSFCLKRKPLSENDQQSSISYGWTYVEPKLLTDVLSRVKYTVRPLSLRRDLPFHAFEKYTFESTDFDLAMQGRVLSHLNDGGFGQVIQDLEKKAWSVKSVNSLVDWAVKMYENWKPTPEPLWVTYVPSVHHSRLLEHFSKLFAQRIGLPLKDVFSVDKGSKPESQETRQNDFFRCRNNDGAYTIKKGAIEPDSPVVLIDTIVMSGITMSTVAALLKQGGSGPVFPLALSMRNRFLF